ncbi:ATP-dependent Clp protease proteolytic subunit [Candidatus Poriferisodalis sp.]|uniref:ATP-dependent Clp protease proteolytic subunit n=1 Tax=Candidatus Poriferisodalis sp. TaxID=3101277 RepID=UPI003B02E73C
MYDSLKAELAPMYRIVCDAAKRLSAEPPSAQRWIESWKAEAKLDGDTLKASVVGPIGPMFADTTAIVSAIKDNEDAKKIEMTIDSPGGNVLMANTLYNLLRSRAKVGVEVVTMSGGVVASAAVTLFLAGKVRESNEATMAMIHKPRLTAMLVNVTEDTFDAEAAKEKEMVVAGTKQIGEVIVARTGWDAKKTNDYMKAEKWFSGKEMADEGLATEYNPDGQKPELDALEGIDDALMANVEHMISNLDMEAN